MKHYIELHGKLEALRQQAFEASSAPGNVGDPEAGVGTRGPCVVIAGPQDVGKSTLAKILINYCVRSGNNRQREMEMVTLS